jgi:probable rRNA maturation factor
VNIFLFKDPQDQIANQAYGVLMANQKPLREAFQKHVDKHCREVNIIIGSSDKVRELNQQFREVDKTTDVLAFSYDEGDLCGEVWLDPIYIKKNAEAFDEAFEDELMRIAIHGLLHVLGYEHDKKFREGSKEEMFVLQEEILNELQSKE